LANIARALGDSHTPLYFLIAASFLNVGLDLLFILAFNAGTFGAALATVIAQLFSAIACLVYMMKKFPILHVPREKWRIDWGAITHLLKMGIPMALQFSITAIGGIILQITINPYGSDIVATLTSASKVQALLVQPLEALGATMATYSSQNLGAGRLDRVSQGLRRSLVLSALFAVAAFIIGITAGKDISLLFISGEETAILAGIQQYLLYVGAFLIPLASLLILRNVVQGLGYAVPAMLAGLFELAARAFVGIAFVRTMGFDAICFSNPAAWVAANVLLIPVYIYVMRDLKVQTVVSKRNSGNEVAESIELLEEAAERGPDV
jgi:Na+-driven multidrug efflux pump